MRKAVVPIKEITVNHGDEFAVLEGVRGALCQSYKLTKADIKRMSDVNDLSFHEDPIEHMIHVVKSVGIEVED